MLNTLWSVLNVALVLGFVYIAFRAVQLVKQHIGLGAALFLSVTLFLISCSKSGSRTSLPSANLLSGVPKNAPLGNASATQYINLGYTNKLFLLAEYYFNNGTIRPRGLYVGVSGLISGHDWEPVYGALEPLGSQVRYTVTLNHHWSLLGLRVFTVNGKTFTGIMPPSK